MSSVVATIVDLVFLSLAAWGIWRAWCFLPVHRRLIQLTHQTFVTLRRRRVNVNPLAIMIRSSSCLVAMLCSVLVALAVPGTALASSWTVFRAEPPPGKSDFGEGGLAGYSCPAAGWCTALVNYAERYEPIESKAYILTETAGVWSRQPVPSGLEGDVSGPMTCPAIGYCVDFTEHYNGPSRELYILSETAGVWTSRPAPLLEGATVIVKDVACPGQEDCVAVGTYNLHGILAPMVLTDTKGTWNTMALPIPAEASPSEPFASLNKVACSEVGKCAAFGYFSLNNTQQEIFAATQTGTSWTETAPIPKGLPFSGNTTISGLACPTGEACTAVGSTAGGGGAGLIFSQQSGGTWTVADAPVPSDYNRFSSVSQTTLNALSCPAAGDCTAVGSYPVGQGSYPVVGESYYRNAIWTQTDGIWSVAPAPAPSEEAFGTLSGVECPAQGYCVAIGEYTRGGKANLATETAGLWSVEGMPTPFGGASWAETLFNGPAVSLAPTSCPAVNSCLIGGDYVDSPMASTRQIGFLYQGGPIYTPTSVSPPQSPPNSGAGSTPPPAPPPPSASSCRTYTVIDSRGSGENMTVHGHTVAEISPPAAYFASEFRHEHPGSSLSIVSNHYPAVGLSGSWREYANLLGAILEVAKFGAYHDSVVAGKKWLAHEIESLVSTCGSTTKILLVGYSQGAQVTGDVVQKLAAKRNTALLLSHILGVALFGDPYFNVHDHRADRGTYEHGLDGVLGARPLFDMGNVLSYCHKYDPVCQGPLDIKTLAEHHFKPHENYPPDAVAAAKYFSRLGRSKWP